MTPETVRCRNGGLVGSGRAVVYKQQQLKRPCNVQILGERSRLVVWGEKVLLGLLAKGRRRWP